jgi:hypothetical protein
VASPGAPVKPAGGCVLVVYKFWEPIKIAAPTKIKESKRVLFIKEFKGLAKLGEWDFDLKM